MFMRIVFLCCLLFCVDLTAGSECRPLFERVNENSEQFDQLDEDGYFLSGPASSSAAFYRRRYKDYPKLAYKNHQKAFMMLAQLNTQGRDSAYLNQYEARYINSISPFRFKTGDKLTKQKLEEILLGVNYRLALKFAYLKSLTKNRMKDANTENDIVQVSIMGLYDGIQRYSKKQETVEDYEFSTVAWYRMLVFNHRQTLTGVSGLFTNNRSNQLQEITTIFKQFSSEFGRKPTDQELIDRYNDQYSSNKLSMAVYGDVKDALIVEYNLLRSGLLERQDSDQLDYTVESRPSEAFIEATRTPMDEILLEEMRVEINDLLEIILSSKSLDLILSRHGLNKHTGFDELTFQQLADTYERGTASNVGGQLKQYIYRPLRKEKAMASFLTTYNQLSSRGSLDRVDLVDTNYSGPGSVKLMEEREAQAEQRLLTYKTKQREKVKRSIERGTRIIIQPSGTRLVKEPKK